MSNKPVLTHRFNSTLALMKAARKYMTHLSRSNKRKSLDRYIHKMDSGMRVLVSHPAVFLLGWGLGGWSAGGGRVGFGFSARSGIFSGAGAIFSAPAKGVQRTPRRSALRTQTMALQPGTPAHGTGFSAVSSIISGAGALFSAPARGFSARHGVQRGELNH